MIISRLFSLLSLALLSSAILGSFKASAQESHPKYAIVQRIVPQEFWPYGTESDPSNVFLIELTDQTMIDHAFRSVVNLNQPYVEQPLLEVVSFSEVKNQGKNVPWQTWQPENVKTIFRGPQGSSSTVRTVVTAVYDQNYRLISGLPRIDYKKTLKTYTENKWVKNDSPLKQVWENKIASNPDVQFPTATQDHRIELNFGNSTRYWYVRDKDDPFALSEKETSKQVRVSWTNGQKTTLFFYLNRKWSLQLVLQNGFNYKNTPVVSFAPSTSDYVAPAGTELVNDFRGLWNSFSLIQTKEDGTKDYLKIEQADVKFTAAKNGLVSVQFKSEIEAWEDEDGKLYLSSEAAPENAKNLKLIQLNFHGKTSVSEGDMPKSKVVNPISACAEELQNQVSPMVKTQLNFDF